MATNTEFKPLDVEAALYLTEEIDSAKAKIAEVEAGIATHQVEIDALRAKRRALEYKIMALSLGAGMATEVENKAKVQKHNGSGALFGDDAHVSSAGFRQTIINVLRDARSGMKPRDVAAKLLEKGVAYTAATDINIRVGNDLYRLAKTGPVKKRGKFYYFTGESLNGEHPA